MKGQVFVVASIFVAVLLLALAINIQPVYTNTNYLQDYFVNVRTEIINTVETSLLTGESYETNLNEYIEFSEIVLEGKGITQEINYQENADGIMVDIYLEKGKEYYKDQIVIPLGVY